MQIGSGVLKTYR